MVEPCLGSHSTDTCMPLQSHALQPQQHPGVTYQSISHLSPFSRSPPCTDLSPPRDGRSCLLHQTKRTPPRENWMAATTCPLHVNFQLETILPLNLSCPRPMEHHLGHLAAPMVPPLQTIVVSLSPCLMGPSPSERGMSVSQMIFWARFFCGGYPMHGRWFSSALGLSELDASKHHLSPGMIRKRCQTSPGRMFYTLAPKVSHLRKPHSFRQTRMVGHPGPDSAMSTSPWSIPLCSS